MRRVIAAAAAVVLLASYAACGDDGVAPARDGGAGAEAGADVVDGGFEPHPCTPAPRPSYVPDGWTPYDDYAPCSSLYVPTDTSQLPQPIAWQDCEPAAGVAGCRRIKIDWAPLPTKPTKEVFTGGDAAIDAEGHVYILSNRDFADADGKLGHRVTFVAEADGPVHSAILATRPDLLLTVGFLAPSFSLPRWIAFVSEDLASGGGGYVAGTIDKPAPTVQHHFGYGVHSASVGPLGVLDVASNATLSLLDFDTGAKLLDIQTPSLPMSFEWMFGGDVYWFGNSGHVADVGRWTKSGGAVDFINYGFNPEHAAGDLGTDGTDMVWVEAHGGPDDAGFFWSTADYWTSPYADDKTKLQPRRLRSAPVGALSGDRIAVGCGYAASFSPGGVWVVRISDGQGWFLANNKGWDWQAPLAVTCSEVFVQVYVSGPISTVARVALDQLGPGVAPD